MLEVVGVARDGRYRYVGESPRPMLYLPFAQAPQARVHFSIVPAPGRSVGLLIGVSATDPATYGAVRAVMGAALLAVSSVPARRAAAADPAAVLRAQ